MDFGNSVNCGDLCRAVGCRTGGEFQAALGNARSSEQKPKTHVILSERSESKNLRIFVMLSNALALRSFDSTSFRSG